MSQPDKFDVIIIGGGPAGSCAALRLLSMGHSVALVEKEVFPRSQIGESLSPGIWNLFDQLGTTSLLEEKTYLHKLPARIIWENKNEEFISHQHLKYYGVIADRSLLDLKIVELAVKRGLHLFQPATFESSQKVGEYWRLVVKHNNSIKNLTSTFILDARGRSGINTSSKVLTAPPTIALWTQIPSKTMPPGTIVEALEQGWLWGSPIPNNSFRLMAFVEPHELKNKQYKTVFTNLLQKGKLFRTAVQKVKKSNIKTCVATTYCHANPWKDNYVKLGESSFALDPLSSTGVEKAIQFSLQTAIAVNTILKKGEQEISQCFYEDRMIESVVTHTIWTKSYYRKAWPELSNSFWYDRSYLNLKYKESNSLFYSKLVTKFSNYKEFDGDFSKRGIAFQNVINSLWNQKVQVSSDVTFIKAPCVVDDYLEVKTVIKHPKGGRVFAYLEQIEIAPFLMGMKTNQTLGQIIFEWSMKMPYEKAIRIAYHLCNMDIIRVFKNI